MNLNKVNLKHAYLVIVVTFLISISVVSYTTNLSFAKTDKDNKDKYNNDLNGISSSSSSSSVDESKKILNDDLKEPTIQNDLLNDQYYPNQFYICGYPQQIISDY